MMEVLGTVVTCSGLVIISRHDNRTGGSIYFMSGPSCIFVECNESLLQNLGKQDPIITVKELAEKLGCDHPTVH